MKERVMLFGASRGGANFIKNHMKDYEILAVADNDTSKHGQFVEGIRIINPLDIVNYHYEKVIITSMFFKSITKQLIDLGVKYEHIDYASKNSMKVIKFPFSNLETLNKAEEIIGFLSKVLRDERYFFTFGTSLGIVRDGALIPWDDDIDVAIFNEDALKIKELILKNVDLLDKIIESKIYIRRYKDNQIASISIDCLENDDLLFNVNLDCIYKIGDIAKKEIDQLPIKFFKDPSYYNFKKYKIKLPTNYEEYLSHVYGDWKTVRKNTNFNNNTTTYIEPTSSTVSQLIYETKSCC